MKNKTFIKFAFALSAVFVLAASSFAQVKLRNALDYDGDQKADVGVFRNGDSTWYINKSAGGSAFRQFGISD
ncbi:MAG TPA: hypothetical protein VGC76_04640 [Pyrinomonadaceae bacterium]|jgi:hypothetical protein